MDREVVIGCSGGGDDLDVFDTLGTQQGVGDGPHFRAGTHGLNGEIIAPLTVMRGRATYQKMKDSAGVFLS